MKFLINANNVYGHPLTFWQLLGFNLEKSQHVHQQNKEVFCQLLFPKQNITNQLEFQSCYKVNVFNY